MVGTTRWSGWSGSSFCRLIARRQTWLWRLQRIDNHGKHNHLPGDRPLWLAKHACSQPQPNANGRSVFDGCWHRVDRKVLTAFSIQIVVQLREIPIKRLNKRAYVQQKLGASLERIDGQAIFLGWGFNDLAKNFPIGFTLYLVEASV